MPPSTGRRLSLMAEISPDWPDLKPVKRKPKVDTNKQTNKNLGFLSHDSAIFWPCILTNKQTKKATANTLKVCCHVRFQAASGGLAISYHACQKVKTFDLNFD